MQKRDFLLAATAMLLTGGRRVHAAPAQANAQQADWRTFLPPSAEISTSLTPISKPASEWRQALPPDSYAVLFEASTEAPFSSPLNGEKRAGLFLCRACRLPLFSSAMKFDSGTGWPSFTTSIPGHLATQKDFKAFFLRTEYHCVRCSGHQGHVFDDGPAPTHERWCNNGVALEFLPSLT